MNRSEEKQIFLLAKMLLRNQDQVKKLVAQNKLAVHISALNFTKYVLKQNLNAITTENLRKVYSMYTAQNNCHEMEGIFNIFQHAICAK